MQARSDSFKDHFSQAALFWNSMSEVEKHIVSAFQFELGKVQRKEIRQQVVDLFANVDSELATRISEGIGTMPPQISGSASSESSPALSMMNTVKLPLTRKVAVLAGNGFTDELPLCLQPRKPASSPRWLARSSASFKAKPVRNWK